MSGTGARTGLESDESSGFMSTFRLLWGIGRVAWDLVESDVVEATRG